MNVNRQTICWDCRHSYAKPDDDFRCPWACDGKALREWTRGKDKVVTRCPRFVEDGVWRPDDVFRGPWEKERGIKYCEQQRAPGARRIVCLEKRKMYPSCMEAMREMSDEGRSNQRLRGTFVFNHSEKRSASKRFKVYGYTWVLLDHDERNGARKTRPKKERKQ